MGGTFAFLWAISYSDFILKLLSELDQLELNQTNPSIAAYSKYLYQTWKLQSKMLLNFFKIVVIYSFKAKKSAGKSG